MLESKEKKCALCGINEEDATLKGRRIITAIDLIKEKFSKMPIEPGIITNLGYICTGCLSGIEAKLDSLNGTGKRSLPDNLEEMNEKSDAFSEYISSSAHLFRLEIPAVSQSVFTCFMHSLKVKISP